jgi:hypothetical protein
MLPLPPTPYEACERVTVRVNSLSLVRYRSNDYSVPTQFGHRQVLVKGYVHRIEIICGSEIIARHQRSYEREIAIYDPLHCSNTRVAHWTKPRLSPDGSYRSALRICGACWKRG